MKKTNYNTTPPKLIRLEDAVAELPKSLQLEIARRSRFLQIALTIKDLRKKFKLTQSDLAKIIDKKREFISRIESGRQNVTLETLYRIGEKLGKEVEVKFV
jgi:DNA-binding XRE family transcriptional regulator